MASDDLQPWQQEAMEGDRERVAERHAGAHAVRRCVARRRRKGSAPKAPPHRPLQTPLPLA